MLSSHLLRTICLMLLATSASAQLVADFTATPTSGVNTLTVNFTVLSTGGPVIAWSWTFGDGGVSAEQHPRHTYTAPGSYTVSLTVFSVQGFDFVQRNDFITVTPASLVADFTAIPTTGVNPLQVSFTDTSTGGVATAWKWDFGDGATSTDQDPSHRYQVAGTTQFTVTLEVFVGQQSDTVVKTDLITVDPAPLVADFEATPVSGVNPLTVSFTDTSTGATTTNWLWNFGDGSISNAKNPVHEYDAPGTYTVKLTAFVGPQSDSIVKRHVVVVDPAPLVVDFSASVTQGQSPLVVTFTDLSSGATVTGWNWDFGDGNTSTLPSPTHTYILPGTHDVSLTAFVGQQGAAATKTGYVAVGHAPLGVPVFGGRTTLVGLSPRDVVEGDFDGDGSPDLLTANSFGSSVGMLLGQGEGGLEFVGNSGIGGSPSGVATADFDGDGVLDVAASLFSSGTVGVILGLGNGGFGSLRTHDIGSSVTDIAAGDVDGDGHQDLVVAVFGEDRVQVLLGDGFGGFTSGASHGVVGFGPGTVELTDVDGDARLDVVTVNSNSSQFQWQSITVLLGNGDGTFAFASEILDLGSLVFSALTFGDFDADGAPDMAVAGQVPASVALLMGAGDGTFQPGATVPLAPGALPGAIAAADLDGDGETDLVTSNSGDDSLSVLSGLGGGAFSLDGALAVSSDPEGIALTDADGDGVIDIMVAHELAKTVSVLLGDGAGGFHGHAAEPVGAQPRAVVVADFDADGVQDLATSNFVSSDVSVLLGTGDGTFGTAPDYAVGSGPEDLVAADFDRDGILDLATADRYDDAVSILLGQGAGTFNLAGSYLIGFGPGHLAAGDLNGDPEIDLVATNGGTDVLTMLWGVGDGSFVLGGTLVVGVQQSAVEIADLDGDGAQDLISVGFVSDSVTVALGAGDGSFAIAGVHPVGSFPDNVAVGDIDEDGVPDLAVCNRFSESVSLLMGLGGGDFAPAVDVPMAPDTRRVALADFDGDGHLDLAASCGRNDVVHVHLGDGTGAFSDAGLFGTSGLAYDIGVGDFDSDGRADLAVTSIQTDRVTVLLTHPVTCTNLGSGLPCSTGIPYLAGSGTLQAGSAGDLTLAKAAPLAPAMLFVSFADAAVPFKCGTLVPVPILTSLLLQTQVDGSLALGWPSWPAGFSGQSLFFQYAVQDAAAPCGVALSNAIRGDVP